MSYRLLRAADKVSSLIQTLAPSKQHIGSVKLLFDEKEKGLAHLVLDHPSKRNALSGSMMLELAKHVETLSNWKEGRAIIVRGSGGNFCAGADLSFASIINTPETGLLMHDLMSTALDELVWIY
jgi:enoyl-CoA hydratase/carnithine racemase